MRALEERVAAVRDDVHTRYADGEEGEDGAAGQGAISREVLPRALRRQQG